MVVQRDASLPAPQRAQFLILETELPQHRHRGALQLAPLAFVGDLRGPLGEQLGTRA